MLRSGKFPAVFHYTSPSAEGRSKAVGFDIDWTIIATKSGKKFPTSAADWKWWHEKVRLLLWSVGWSKWALRTVDVQLNFHQHRTFDRTETKSFIPWFWYYPEFRRKAEIGEEYDEL